MIEQNNQGVFSFTLIINKVLNFDQIIIKWNNEQLIKKELP